MRQKVFVCWQTCIETLSCDDHVFGTDEDRRRKTCRIYTRAREVRDEIPSQFLRQLSSILLASAFFCVTTTLTPIIFYVHSGFHSYTPGHHVSRNFSHAPVLHSSHRLKRYTISISCSPSFPSVSNRPPELLTRPLAPRNSVCRARSVSIGAVGVPGEFPSRTKGTVNRIHFNMANFRDIQNYKLWMPICKHIILSFILFYDGIGYSLVPLKHC